MVFKTSIQVTPAANSTMSVINFAWLPKRIGDVKVWLQRYETIYMYDVRVVKALVNKQPMEFDIANWIKLSERVIV